MWLRTPLQFMSLYKSCRLPFSALLLYALETLPFPLHWPFKVPRTRVGGNSETSEEARALRLASHKEYISF